MAASRAVLVEATLLVDIVRRLEALEGGGQAQFTSVDIDGEAVALPQIGRDAVTARAAAVEAQAAANGKNVVWYVEPPAGPHTVGDTWFEQTDTGRRIRRWDGTEWAVVQLDGTLAIAEASIGAAQIAEVDADTITVGTLRSITLDGVIVTGSTVQTGGAGNRAVLRNETQADGFNVGLLELHSGLAGESSPGKLTSYADSADPEYPERGVQLTSGTFATDVYGEAVMAVTSRRNVSEGTVDTFASIIAGHVSIIGDDVTVGGQQAVMYRRTSAQAVPNGTDTAVSWQSTLYNDGAYPGSGTAIAVPHTGWYLVLWNVGLVTNTTGRRATWLVAGGVSYAGNSSAPAESLGTFLGGQALVHLTAGQTVAVYVNQSSGASLNIDTWNNVTRLTLLRLAK